MNWLIKLMKGHYMYRFLAESEQERAERIMIEAQDVALNNLTEMEDLESYGSAMKKYDSKLEFLGSPEFWQAFRPEGEWANHAQYFYFLSDAEKIAYLEQLLPSSQ